jgi:site-specific recombinase XerD
MQSLERNFQRFLKNKPPGYDIRVIQNLLGHTSLKTTMI